MSKALCVKQIVVRRMTCNHRSHSPWVVFCGALLCFSGLVKTKTLSRHAPIDAALFYDYLFICISCCVSVPVYVSDYV